jgi:phospholipid transport system substrate-binding protein
MWMKRLLAALVVSVICAGLPGIALAAEAESFVKAKQAELIGLLKRPKSAANDEKVEAICDQILDYDTIAKESLADQWQTRSEGERKEFRSLLKQLVQRAYRKNLNKTVHYDLSYVGEVKTKDGTLVKTVAKDRKNAREEPVTIDFNVHKAAAGQLKIRDIVTEGSSLVGNYRSQFRRIIKTKGWDELLKRMKARLEKDEG